MSGEVIFKLLLVDRDERIATFPGGGQAEMDLVGEIAKRLAGKVSLVTTRSKVQAAMAEAVSEAIYSLKEKSRSIP